MPKLIKIDSSQEKQRLDTFLSEHEYPDKSRSYVQTLIKDEKILVNGVKVKTGYTLKEGDAVEAMVHAATETVLTCELPVKVTLKVTYTEPGIKGDTATNTLKPATVETGAEVRVPLFINEGEFIEVDTRNGSYLGRVR